ncbi:hypothetical protein [Paraburkholderia tropica]|uniref:hypothetical protein n=1 Tax=Paraburkholderia tropica TaxID=92647 RepID=UPI002AAF24AC|nr:hypothetical protein [Paraburkholderia tropica]
MAYGLRIRDANNKVILDTSYGMGRILGQIAVSASGSMVVDGFSQGTPFVMVHQDNSNRYGYFTASISGTTLTWTFNGSGSKAATLSYGVY